MRPEDLKTKIFLDSGDPAETREAINVLGFLDGQTTNPSLIAKGPEAKKRIEKGELFTEQEILEYYKSTVQEIAGLLPGRSVSIEVPASRDTTAEEMMEYARDMFSWIDLAHIKLPTTEQGLQAAEQLVGEGMRVNMTLVFSQEQAAAVHAATKGAAKGSVFVSPFDGRLDDIGVQGDDVLENILRMYREVGSHIEVLSASMRDLESFLYAIQLGADIVTLPLDIITQWAETDKHIPSHLEDLDSSKGLEGISYAQLDLNQPWERFDTQHALTEKGLEKFNQDWQSLIEKN